VSAFVGIYGAGGCGRGVMPLARKMSALSNAQLVFIDDGPIQAIVNGHPVMSYADFRSAQATSKAVAIALAKPTLRERLANELLAAGITLQSIWADDVIVMDNVEVGQGALVSPRVTLTSNIHVGVCFHANLHSIIEHDCNIGNFVTFAPGVHCNGGVTIGDRSYIGAGAMIRQGVTIGADAVIGMGAVVIRDVPSGTTVVGNPARRLLRNRDA
jgi:sugar O-acyltransferase (sialic acid O-acetyltransferase NeuD family)